MATRRLTGLDMTGQKISNLADPSNAADAVTLSYLQAFLRGLRWKDPVRAASLANVSLAAPGAQLDGVTLVTNDRILLKNQTAPAENGIYVWTGASAALTRAQDADTGAKLLGAAVTVLEGSAPNGDKVFVQTTDGTITVGTTAVNFAAVGGSGTSYTAGNGLQLSGSAFSVVVGNGLIVDGSGVRVDPSIVAQKKSINAAAATTTTFVHNLGTLDVLVSFRDIATGEVVQADVTVTDPNTIVATFANAPAANAIRITVHA